MLRAVSWGHPFYWAAFVLVGDGQWGAGRHLTQPAPGNTVIPIPTFSFKAQPAEAKAIRAAARKRGLSVSEYLRQVAVARPARGRRVRTQLTLGRVVIKGSADAPTLTSADIAAALYK